MKFNSKEEIEILTPLWKGERMDDGRPYVPQKHLDALKKMTLEEIWKPIFSKGYENQFEGRLHNVFTGGKKMIGRAVTATFCPARPDLDQVASREGELEKRSGLYNQWVIDSLSEGDVVIADMFDKIYKGTFVGGNLATAIKNKTKTGGAVIWGGIRDLEQISAIEGIQIYYRGIDPTPIRDIVMTGFNTAARIGKSVCLPGDVVFGTDSGVLFIPPHLVEEVIYDAQKTKAKDMFGFEMISQNKFTTAEIDRHVWTTEMLDMLTRFIETDSRALEFKDIDWSKEYEEARTKSDDKQSSL